MATFMNRPKTEFNDPGTLSFDKQLTLFLSNGHGEDVCGAAIASCLKRIAPEKHIVAFPIVGTGAAYKKAGIPIIGPHKDLPYGGHIWGRPIAILTDVSHGLSLLFKQIKFMKNISDHVQEVIAVGDVVPLLYNQWWLKKPLFYHAIAKSAYYRDGRPPIIEPRELKALQGYAKTIFLRDRFTWESARHQCPNLDLRFVGNPMMDNINATGVGFPVLAPPIIGILPGSRQTAYKNLGLLLKIMKSVIHLSPNANYIISKAPQLSSEQMDQILTAAGWRFVNKESETDTLYAYAETTPGQTSGQKPITVLTSRFGDLITTSDIIVGLTGTANEQAVGLGKPVINFPVNSTRFAWFLVEQQSKLLGSSLNAVHSREPEEIAAKITATLNAPEDVKKQRAADGIDRMGNGPGASERIARVIAGLDN